MKVAVVQKGARHRHLVSRVLQRQGNLGVLATDAVGPRPESRLSKVLGAIGPSRARRWSARYPRGVPRELIRSASWRAIEWELRARAGGDKERVGWEINQRFQAWAVQVLRDSPSVDGIYAVNGGAQQVFRHWRGSRRLVLEQCMASAAFEKEKLSAMMQTFPEWSYPLSSFFDRRFEVEQDEWAHADTILAASNLVRDDLLRRGVPKEKIKGIHYSSPGATTGQFAAKKLVRGQPLQVVTAGQFGLRKGAPIAIDVCRAMGGQVSWTWMGSVACPTGIRSSLPSNLHLLGPVPHSEAIRQIDNADIMILPSCCEGSAVSLLEAMARGRTVVCTHESGPVEEVGALFGRVVDLADATEQILDALVKYIACPESLLSESQEAIIAARKYSSQLHCSGVLSAFGLDAEGC